MNLTPPTRGFEQAEFEARVERAQRIMTTSGLAALLLTTEPEVRYFSGFLTRFWLSPTRPWFLVVPRVGRPVAVIPEIGAPLMARTWVEDIRAWPSPRPEDEGITLLAKTLRGLGGAGTRVGLPMGAETHLRMPLNDFVRLRAELPTTQFVDARDELTRLRMVKSEAEIAKIRHACQIASDAFDSVPRLARSGMPLDEVFRAFKIALLEAGADDVPYLVGGAALGGYDNVISPPDDRPLRHGDLLMMDTGAVWDGYYCDFDRNYAVGPATDETRRAYSSLYRATEAGFVAARPGATCTELFHAMRTVILDDGFECSNIGRLGHGLGMQLTEWPSHTADDATVLTDGMVITLEPGLRMDSGRSMVHEENIVVRNGGPEYLSRRAPRELPELS